MQQTPNVKFIAIVLLFVTVLLISVPTMMGGGFFGAVRVLALSLPLILALLLFVRPVWMGLLLGAIVYSDPLSEIVFFDRFRLGMVVCAIMIAFYVAASAMKKRESLLPGDLIKRMWTVLAILITVRIAVDPPGSARTGEVGGMGEAILYLVGAWSFFASAWVTTLAQNYRKQIRLALILALVVEIRTIVQSAHAMFGGFYWGSLFARPMWLLLACLLALSLGYRKKQEGYRPWFYFWALFGVAISVMAEHRSRPLFALAMALTVAALYKRTYRTALIIGVCGVLALARILAVNQGHIPRVIVRALSIVVPIERAEYSDLGETGWESKFRQSMNKVGFENIRRQPLVGKGYAYTQKEILDLVNTERLRTGNSGADIGVLSRAGGYHNTALALAVSTGVPACLMYLFCIIATAVSFFRHARRETDPDRRMMSAVLLAFFAPSFGQMLMNGHGYDFIVMAVLIGMMRAVQKAGEGNKGEGSPGIQNTTETSRSGLMNSGPAGAMTLRESGFSSRV